MKKTITLVLFPLILVSSGCVSGQQIFGVSTQGGLSTEQIANGLKEALSIGSKNSADRLSAADGFFKDAVIKILLPEEAQKAERTLRNLGFGKLVDDAILSLNRAAEEASKEAAPIFINAIKQMTIQDAIGILKGGDFAATNYLKEKTTAELTEKFRPVIKNALDKVDATKYWSDVFTTYNKLPTTFKKVNPDLTSHVTTKALDGLFYYVGIEEQKIRKDPVARVTDILKSVFGSKIAQGGQ